MLIGASFMPAAFELLHKVPEGKSEAGLITAGVTVIIVVAPNLTRPGLPAIMDTGHRSAGRFCSIRFPRIVRLLNGSAVPAG